jgi:hypothetical protein
MQGGPKRSQAMDKQLDGFSRLWTTLDGRNKSADFRTLEKSDAM